MESVEEFESLESPEFENVFIVMDFQDSVFNDLYKADQRIIGPPVILNCAQKGEVRKYTFIMTFTVKFLLMNFVKIHKQKNPVNYWEYVIFKIGGIVVTILL